MRALAIVVIATVSLLGVKIFAQRAPTKIFNDAASDVHSSSDQVGIIAHLEQRLIRFIRLGAMAQSIHVETGIPRDQIFVGGPSQYQDRSQTGGNHASHVIRAQHGNSLMRHRAAWTKVRDFLGHTQSVPRWVNLGIGKLIDTIQSENVHLLDFIDFCEELTPEGKEKIEEIKQKFLDALDRKINDDIPDEQRKILTEARASISAIIPEFMFLEASLYGLEREDCDEKPHSGWVAIDLMKQTVIRS